MDGITGALTKHYGPLPGYAWAGIIALGAWLLIPLVRGASSSAGKATPTAGAPGPAGPPGTAGAAGTSGAPGQAGANASSVISWHNGPATAGDTLWRYEPGFAYQRGFGTEANFITGDRSGRDGIQYGAPVNAGPALPFGRNSGAVGGPGKARSIGNRRAQLMSAHHPDLKRPVRVTQTIAAVGGPGNHAANLRAVARQTGVHPARLQALNPFYSGVIRIH